MASVKINVSDVTGYKGFDIAGDWMNGTFDDMVADLPDILTKSLSTAGYILKESVKDTFGSKMPAANRPFRTKTPSGKQVTTKGGYPLTRADKLVDAAMQSKKSETHVTVFMGSGGKGSPKFISRMYEDDSKPRYIKSKNGVKLKKPRYVGKLTGVHYWNAGLESGESEAFDAMERIIGKNLEENFK